MKRALRPGKRIAYYDNDSYPGYAEFSRSSKRRKVVDEATEDKATIPTILAISRTAREAVKTAKTIASSSPDAVPNLIPNSRYQTPQDYPREASITPNDFRAPKSSESSNSSPQGPLSSVPDQKPCKIRCTHQRRCPIPRPSIPFRHPKECKSTPALEAPGYLFKCDKCDAKYKNGKDLANHLMGLGADVQAGHGFYNHFVMFVVSSVRAKGENRTWHGKFQHDEKERWKGLMVIDDTYGASDVTEVTDGEEGESEEKHEHEQDRGETRDVSRHGPSKTPLNEAGSRGVPEYWTQADDLESRGEEGEDEHQHGGIPKY